MKKWTPPESEFNAKWKYIESLPKIKDKLGSKKLKTICETEKEKRKNERNYEN